MKTRYTTRVLLALCVFVSAGCQPKLNTQYGTLHGDSVNGVGVWMNFLKADGHVVGVANSLKPSLHDFVDVIIYFDDGEGLQPEAVDWINNWLDDDWPDRHFVLVLRDYDAAVDYWQQVLNKNKSAFELEQRLRMDAELISAKANESSFSKKTMPLEPGDWYGVEPFENSKPVTSTSLEFDEQWRDYFEETDGFQIRLLRKLLLPNDAYPMATAGDNVLVSRQSVGEGNVWIVANGSFLLNYSLVNHQHRKLAQALGDSIDYEGRIVFLRNAVIGEDDDVARTLWYFLTINPINWIAGHILVMLLLYIGYRVAIFGRPIEKPRRECYRFGKHVDALGDLLKATGDIEYARERIAAFKKHTVTTRDVPSTREPQ